MADRAVTRSFGRIASASLRHVREIVRGAAGLDAYERYLEHLRTRHPGAQPMTREEFFRADMAMRWNGVRRCC
jgi:uncharacterized short protein YbdD (DUF466 family)